MDLETRGDAPIGHAVDQELDLLDAAMALVLERPAERVVLAGLRYGEDLIRLRHHRAAGMGLVLEPLWSLDEQGCDVRVRVAGSTS
jgi:hypothetical protein